MHFVKTDQLKFQLLANEPISNVVHYIRMEVTADDFS